MECPICLDTIDETTGSMKLPCAHTFHIECALRWLRTNSACPCCRTRYQAPATQSTIEHARLIERRMNEIDYNDILTETMRIIVQPWTVFDGPQELWNMLDPDSQGRQIRIWLVEHSKHVFEQQFRLLLNEVSPENDIVISESPMESDQVVLYTIGGGVCFLFALHFYKIMLFLYHYIM